MISILSIIPGKFSKVSLKNVLKTFLLVLKCILFLLGVGVDSDRSSCEFFYLYSVLRGRRVNASIWKEKISHGIRHSHWKGSRSPFLELLINLPVPWLSSFFFFWCACVYVNFYIKKVLPSSTILVKSSGETSLSRQGWLAMVVYLEFSLIIFPPELGK